jgi:hypothetical protein
VRHRALRPVRTRPTWARVLARFGTPEKPHRNADGEQLWLRPSDLQRIELQLRPGAGLLLVCAKNPLVSWWNPAGLPRDVATLTAAHLTDSTAMAVLSAVCRTCRAAVFVGDLDPYSIVQHVETRRLLARDSGCAALLYGGIDDAWLARMDQNAIRPSDVGVRIPLSRDELTLLQLIERSVDLEEIVGRRASSVLESGFKVELEGATNPNLYSPAHGQWLLRYLRSRAVTHTRPRGR